eukprot:gene6118-7623_t
MSNIKVLKAKKVVIDGSIRSATILIRDKIIYDILPYETEVKDEWVKILDDALSVNEEIVVMGGLVDSHVHVNEPGRTEWEGFVTATSAAAAGGVTTIIDMPLNSSPVTTSFEHLQTKIASMPGKLKVDVGLLGGIIPENAKEIKKMVLEGGVVGFKSFLVHSGIDEFPSVDRVDIQKAMNEMKELKELNKDVVMMFHAEVPEPIDEACKLLKDADPRLYNTFLQSRPRASENQAIDLVIDMSKQNQVRTHIVHLSSSDAIQSLRKAIDEDKVPISAETTFHYLYFVSEQVPDGNTLYKCCPPVREQENKHLLWDAVQNGPIDIIVSDHSPCTVDLKLLEEGDFMKAWGGIASLQLGLSIIWTEAKKLGIPLTKLSEWMSDAPARLVNLNDRKGSIKIGRDADFVIWNPEEKFVVDQEKMYIKNRHSPYHGFELHGKIMQTILGGNCIYNGETNTMTNTDFTGQHLVPTSIQTSLTYPKPQLPSIYFLNTLPIEAFFQCLSLLFEAAPPLADKLYQLRPFTSYMHIIESANTIIESLSEAEKLVVINSHPRIGLSPNEIKKQSIISYREQGYENPAINLEEEELLNVLSQLKTLNDAYEQKFGFLFIVFVNGRSKADLIPVFESRIKNDNKLEELNLGLSELIAIAKSRLSKLI